jgi:hypothetical protein
MQIDTGASQGAARLLYPDLPDPLTPADLRRLFRPTYAECQWAPSVARTPLSQVALVVQLKIFQVVGRFLRIEEIPAVIVESVAAWLRIEGEIRLLSSARTLQRQRTAILEHLGVSAWTAQTQELAHATMIKIAEARTGPAELINAAVDVLVRGRCELPSLDTLRRLAKTVHRQVNATQWQLIGDRLDERQRAALDALLIVDPTTQESPFSALCRAPGRPSRRNLNALLDRHQWLQQLPDPTAPLQAVAEAKVLQWGNEARRLKAPELREYVALRRRALLLALIRLARGQVLDNLTYMLLRITRKIEWRSGQRLEEFVAGRRAETDALIEAFHESLQVHGSEADPGEKVRRLEALFAARGGRDTLERTCTEHLRHAKQSWRPFARRAFEPFRSPLLRVAHLLPLQATLTSLDLLRLVSAVTGEEPPYSDYITVDELTRRYVSAGVAESAPGPSARTCPSAKPPAIGSGIDFGTGGRDQGRRDVCHRFLELRPVLGSVAARVERSCSDGGLCYIPGLGSRSGWSRSGGQRSPDEADGLPQSRCL